MTSFQYEALCRHAISRLCKIPINQVHTGYLPGATISPDKTRHQIDLYWTATDGLCQYLCFANAKWRTEPNAVRLHELLTLIAVQQEIKAQKAMMITNTHFTTPVITQAKDKGIALLILRPAFDTATLISARPSVVLKSLEEKANTHPIQPLFSLEIIHRAFNFPNPPHPLAHSPAPDSQNLDPDPDTNPGFLHLIHSETPAEDAIHDKSMSESDIDNRILEGAQPPHPSPTHFPFTIRTK